MKKKYKALYSFTSPSPYVRDMVSVDFGLSLRDKLKILFSDGIHVILVGEDVEKLRIELEKKNETN